MLKEGHFKFLAHGSLSDPLSGQQHLVLFLVAVFFGHAVGWCRILVLNQASNLCPYSGNVES